ncbi:hypothetical protein LZP85_08015 [Priestia flexa]|jgi:hypothetical protein|uniref:Uncharacterized protein n=1 Tax=Priestia flexa TaxID=86664 RepID=A0A8I1SMZ1_9BACI|nr:hypothetical protein [Priestia flexa]MBN8251388.1 hypothetical protein [Priestia flexa]MBN8434349.1 hypothetical protein [Priestia flexa]MCA0966867.1 hypothetical protein [Priestia flexa]UIR31715.1 hypothetical protein LZP85_08015 [Priestia flexa]UZW65543.1 hypothetical protein OC195_15745 [Priestia flexa]
MTDFTSIEKSLQMAEQAVYQFQMSAVPEQFQKAQNQLAIAQENITKLKSQGVNSTEIKKAEEHLKHLKEAQIAVQFS